jgi:gliding motility-associated-like protein
MICATITSVPLTGLATFDSLVTWSTNGSGTFSAPSALNTIYNLSAAELASGGSVVLTLRVTPKSPCPVVDAQTVINIVQAPLVDAGQDSSKCADDPSVHLAGVVTNAIGGTWSGSGVFSPDNTTLDAVYTPTATEINAGLATLTLTTINSSYCPVATDIVNIIINPLPLVDLGNDQKLCPESDSPVTFDAGTGGGPGARFVWQPSIDTLQYINVTTPGTYTVTVYTQYGCKASSSVNLLEVCPPRLFISNSFTPNDDKTNDYYNVYGARIANFHMFIFNRWGEIIYESKDMHEAWDGVYRGELMPIGVYPWIITYTGDSEEYYGPYRLEGSVTLVR